MKKTIFISLFIALWFASFTNVFALEEISFPDVTFIQNSEGSYVKKEEKVVISDIKDESKISQNDNVKNGYATYYGTSGKFEGKKTASGEIFRRNLMTAAMNNIPLGTIVKVTNKTNGKYVVVKVNDRMGSTKNIIDLSSGAFAKIAKLSTGRISVSVEVLKK